MAEKHDHAPAVKFTHHVHWITMIALAVSGYYIHAPFAEGLMGTMRYIHFVAMYVLAFTWAFRFYYALFGARRDIRDFMPEKENRGKLLEIIKYYLFLRKTHPVTGRYNPLQKSTYVFWFFLIILQGLTGFGLYWPQSALFGWVVELFNGLRNLRMVHYLIMWVFVVTTGIHVYLTLAEDFSAFRMMFLGKKEEPSS